MGETKKNDQNIAQIVANIGTGLADNGKMLGLIADNVVAMSNKSKEFASNMRLLAASQQSDKLVGSLEYLLGLEYLEPPVKGPKSLASFVMGAPLVPQEVNSFPIIDKILKEFEVQRDGLTLINNTWAEYVETSYDNLFPDAAVKKHIHDVCEDPVKLLGEFLVQAELLDAYAIAIADQIKSTNWTSQIDIAKNSKELQRLLNAQNTIEKYKAKINNEKLQLTLVANAARVTFAKYQLFIATKKLEKYQDNSKATMNAQILTKHKKEVAVAEENFKNLAIAAKTAETKVAMAASSSATTAKPAPTAVQQSTTVTLGKTDNESEKAVKRISGKAGEKIDKENRLSTASNVSYASTAGSSSPQSSSASDSPVMNAIEAESAPKKDKFGKKLGNAAKSFYNKVTGGSSSNQTSDINTAIASSADTSSKAAPSAGSGKKDPVQPLRDKLNEAAEKFLQLDNNDITITSAKTIAGELKALHSEVQQLAASLTPKTEPDKYNSFTNSTDYYSKTANQKVQEMEESAALSEAINAVMQEYNNSVQSGYRSRIRFKERRNAQMAVLEQVRDGTYKVFVPVDPANATSKAEYKEANAQLTLEQKKVLVCAAYRSLTQETGNEMLFRMQKSRLQKSLENHLSGLADGTYEKALVDKRVVNNAKDNGEKLNTVLNATAKKVKLTEVADDYLQTIKQHVIDIMTSRPVTTHKRSNK